MWNWSLLLIIMKTKLSVCDDRERDTTKVSTESIIRRSQRVRRAPDFYGARVNVANSQLMEPTSLKEALASPEREKWSTAMENEMNSLRENDVWDLVELPRDRSPVGQQVGIQAKNQCRWIY